MEQVFEFTPTKSQAERGFTKVLKWIDFEFKSITTTLISDWGNKERKRDFAQVKGSNVIQTQQQKIKFNTAVKNIQAKGERKL